MNRSDRFDYDSDDPDEVAQAAGAAPVEDDRQASLIGGHHELSFLSDLQVHVLVTAWVHGQFERAVRSIPASLHREGGVEVGPQRFEGTAAVEAVTALLHAGYLARRSQGHLAVTARGRRLGEIAAQSARTMRLRDDPRGHA